MEPETPDSASCAVKGMEPSILVMAVTRSNGFITYASYNTNSDETHDLLLLSRGGFPTVPHVKRGEDLVTKFADHRSRPAVLPLLKVLIVDRANKCRAAPTDTQGPAQQNKPADT